MNFIFLEDGGDDLLVELGLGHLDRERQAALFLLLEVNVRRLLVQPNAETFQLVLDNLLVPKGL